MIVIFIVTSGRYQQLCSGCVLGPAVAALGWVYTCQLMCAQTPTDAHITLSAPAFAFNGTAWASVSGK